MRTYLSIFIIIISFAGIQSCSKYTDIKTQGALVPNETSNYRFLLNNTSAFERTANLPDIASDDISIVDNQQITNLSNGTSYLYYVNAYSWKSPIYQLVTDLDPDWNTLYTTIYNANLAIDEVPGSKGGNDSVKAELIAEAKVHRAYSYLMLVNMYGKAYNASTAATDLGVPLILKPTVSEVLTRAKVSEVYNQILSDLTSAIPALPKLNTHNTLPSKAAAYAVLARTYLYRADYSKAGLYADSALLLKSGLNNLATLTTSSFPGRVLDPEIILSKQANSSLSFMPIALRLSDSLVNLLGTKDKRYEFFTKPASFYSSTLYTGRFFGREVIGSFETRNVGPNVPEMMLISAEAAARRGDITTALDRLNTLRKTRFAAADYVLLSASTQQEALTLVLQERQRELFCRGARWFDMKRLQTEAPYTKTYTRTFGTASFQLAPGDSRYVFPISEYVRSFNPGIEQNQ